MATNKAPGLKAALKLKPRIGSSCKGETRKVVQKYLEAWERAIIEKIEELENPVELYQCQSYFDGERVQNCTCGRCE